MWVQREKECESSAWTDQKRVTERMVAVDWNQIMESASMKRLLLADGPSVGYVFRRHAAVIYALFQYYAVVGGQARPPRAAVNQVANRAVRVWHGATEKGP